jgi:predicted phosphoribosyltransferase
MSPAHDATRFADRTDAGDRLAAELRERGVSADIVLAIPRGGLPVGRAVADALGVPLDVVVAKKLGAPGNPELAIGAAASDGTVWLDDDLRARLHVGDAYLARERERAVAAAREKADRYRGGRDPPALAGERVLVVDDGLATGATARAALRQVRDADAAAVVLAVPVGPPETVAELRAEADDIVCVLTPGSFGAVGRFYRRFDQVSDTEAIAYLRE